MANQYVKSIDGYLVKDAEARASIDTINNSISQQNGKINEHTTKINQNTEDINVLKAKSHLQPVYDATNESITFE